MPAKVLVLILMVSLFLSSCKLGKNQDQDYELPNIVLIIGDDFGYPYYGFMGADYLQTPNLDELARQGVVFTRGFTPSNYCRPSLLSLTTGILPIQYQTKLNVMMGQEKQGQDFSQFSDEELQRWELDFEGRALRYFTSLPGLLSEKGYVSFQCGKWWEEDYQIGGFTEGRKVRRQDPAADVEFVRSRYLDSFFGEIRPTGESVQPVLDFIDQNTHQPFFIWFAPPLPHYPFNAPEKYYNLYRDKDMSESAKRYYANCTWFDDGLGILMNHMKETGEFENTLFIYVSDNGWEQNPDQEFWHDPIRSKDGGDKGKKSMFDQSFRTPIIFTWEVRIAKGKVKEDLIYIPDIPATVLDYVGLPAPKQYYGKSYRTVIVGTDSNLRNEIIGDATQTREWWKGEAYWLRNDKWFFTWNATADTEVLYNMDDDPFSNNDVAGDYPELVDKYKKRLKSGDHMLYLHLKMSSSCGIHFTTGLEAGRHINPGFKIN